MFGVPKTFAFFEEQCREQEFRAKSKSSKRNECAVCFSVHNYRTSVSLDGVLEQKNTIAWLSKTDVYTEHLCSAVGNRCRQMFAVDSAILRCENISSVMISVLNVDKYRSFVTCEIVLIITDLSLLCRSCIVTPQWLLQVLLVYDSCTPCFVWCASLCLVKCACDFVISFAVVVIFIV